MKLVFSLMALILVSVAFTPIAEAKKFGGGKSFGKSFKTAPAPAKKAPDTQNVKPNTNKANGAAPSKGLMGGILGGLLAGGLLAAFFGGAFEGIQFLDILILAALAFIGVKLLRSLMGAKQQSINASEPAFSTGTTASNSRMHVHNFEAAQPESSASRSLDDNEVPYRYPAGFDETAFVEGACDHYRTLQQAWNDNELTLIKEYVSEALFNDLRLERAKLAQAPKTQVMYVDAQIVRADYDANLAQLSLQFSGRYRDEQSLIEEEIQDIWHLERDLTQPQAPWLIVGIQNT